jgi:hypothetical protein
LWGDARIVADGVAGARPAAGRPRLGATAVNWLLDLCPPDFRGYPVLARQPAVLAWLAGHHLEGQVQACRRAMATARADLGGLPPQTLRETLEVLEAELARLVGTQRALGLVAQALSGVRFVPRL